ncbi:uncharacterized protein LOC114933816, partial [Nylanderia fulva]|uniref:uncharacterized protein LOC114933816 n=1 Tax=Nylanderia fulva TaxID=613905 RepID=UPI0010FBA3A5
MLKKYLTLWLKRNNTLYSHIILPNDYNDLRLPKLKNLEFQIEDETEVNAEIADDETELLNETEDNVEVADDETELLNETEGNAEVADDETELLNDPIEEIKNDMLEGQRKAMLTQVTNAENDGYYEQYTIYPLYEKKANKTATALYQMLKIQDLPLNNREQHLDLMCFPDLYSSGINGQPAEYLDAMSKELLESNLSTIFATLRNTEQYWCKPRNDLNCMTQHYGPATWFLTLSPSEWLWEDLGEYIREVNEWHDASLSVSALVVRDPVSTSRFLDNKFRAMLDFIRSKDHPIGEVTHYFWRREYQGRGRKVIRRCRFGFPRPVTETLNIRDVATSIAGRKQLKHKSRLYDLPRTDNEGNINDYNPVLLTAWEGNMDIQFIGEKSSLLTCKDNKNKSLASHLWNIALRFTNNRECGALEAADTLLDIFYQSLTDDHYPHRPNELENTSLYEFAQWYDISKIKPKNKFIEYYKIGNGCYLKRRQRGYLINHFRYNVNTQPENYFFALLLMFKPWRKLEDLKNECDTYTESFHKVKLHLKEALQYHERLEELQKAFETAKQLVQQCLDDDLQKEQSQDDPENAIGIQNIEAGEAMQDFKDLGDRAIQEIDVSDMIVKLNTDQKRVFDKVTNAVESDKSILRLYVSGEGGTGKSFLIKTIKCWIKQNLNKDTAVTAPTGIAAFNIDGLTVHRLLQLPVEHGQTHKYKQLSDCVLKVLRTDLKDVILFVIDEVSMISNLTLIYIHLRLSEIFDTSDCDDGWFGRKHILLFGDLLQLPPVREDLIFTHLSDQKIANYLGSLNAVNLWITLFEYDELIINMRQQGDNSYRELLSRIRIGLVTKSDCKILESRKISFKADSFESRLNELCDFINSLSSDTVCLFPTCNMCDVNNAMLSRITSKEILLIAEDTIDCTSYVKKKVLKVLSNNDDDSSRTAGLSKQITIKIGAKVMIRRNIDASLGLVNGTIAKVISIVRETSTDDVEKIKLLLPSGLEYEIERVTAKFQVLDRAYVIRKQFPLSLSYGITIHKSQGLSLQSVVMDIGNSVFSCGQIYVALSRVTSLEGVHLINFDPSAVIANEKVIIEYNRLKQIYNPKAEMIAVSKERCPQDGKLIKAENKFNLCAVPTTKVLIAGQLYKTMSAILYDSSCTDEGHYDDMWTAISQSLNATRNGPQKQAKEWQK